MKMLFAEKKLKKIFPLIIFLTTLNLIFTSYLIYTKTDLKASQDEYTITEAKASNELSSTKDSQKQFAILKSIAEDKDAKTAWDTVVSTFNNESGTQGNVHDLAHYTGYLLYEEKGFTGLKDCNPLFAFGCYHGLLDTAFAKDLNSLKEAEKGCLLAGPLRSGPYASCIHGIGHGVASYYQSNDLTDSLITCEQIKTDPNSCYDGVFMEFEREAPDNFYNPNDPLYPCNTLEDKYLYSCGRNQPNVMLSRLGISHQEVANTCMLSNEVKLRDSCSDALGFQAAYQSNSDPTKIIDFCHIFTDENYHARCVRSAAGELIFQNMPSWQTSSPTACNFLKESFRKSCLDYINMIKKEYNK